MEVDLTSMLTIFDEQSPSPITNEKIGIYGFKVNRHDGLTVALSFSIYEGCVSILVSEKDGGLITQLDMKHCSQIRVLDEGKKQLEIVHDILPGRCFIWLVGDDIVSYDE
jgi:hypothetical protein